MQKDTGNFPVSLPKLSKPNRQPRQICVHVTLQVVQLNSSKIYQQKFG